MAHRLALAAHFPALGRCTRLDAKARSSLRVFVARRVAAVRPCRLVARRLVAGHDPHVRSGVFACCGRQPSRSSARRSVRSCPLIFALDCGRRPGNLGRSRASGRASSRDTCRRSNAKFIEPLALWLDCNTRHTWRSPRRRFQLRRLRPVAIAVLVGIDRRARDLS